MRNYQPKTISYDKYDETIENPNIVRMKDEISLLFNQRDEIDNKIKEIKNNMEEIQSQCPHQYYFVCSGGYEDSFTCKLCGHER